MVKGMGGAIDLVASVSRVVVLMEHTARGEPKILKHCGLPLPGKGVFNLTVTDLCVFDVLPAGGGLVLADLAPDVTANEMRAKTEAESAIHPDLASKAT